MLQTLVSCEFRKLHYVKGPKSYQTSLPVRIWMRLLKTVSFLDPTLRVEKVISHVTFYQQFAFTSAPLFWKPRPLPRKRCGLGTRLYSMRSKHTLLPTVIEFTLCTPRPCRFAGLMILPVGTKSRLPETVEPMHLLDSHRDITLCTALLWRLCSHNKCICACCNHAHLLVKTITHFL